MECVGLAPMSPSTVLQWVPGASALASYQRRWLPKDIVAGLVLSALLVPQGMAYAELAGLPPVTGLYTSILCLVGYAVFGPSKVLVLGPDSALGPMIAATILPLAAADGDPARAIALASMLAVMTGAIMIAAGVLKFGFIADLLSKPTILGYMNGLALTIVVGQLPKLLGFSVDADGFIEELVGVVTGISDGQVVAAAATVGVGSILLILALQRFIPKLPAVLVTVVLAIVAVKAFDLVEQGVKVVGALPQGLPLPTLPSVGLSDLAPLFIGAMGIALVALTDTISTASSFAERRGDDVDGNKEMFGIGSANVAAGLFQGFPVSTSGSRTAVAEQAGGRTQLTGLVGARGHRRDARGPALPVRRPAAAHPRRSGDHGGDHVGRPPGDQAVVAPQADRLHHVPRRLCRRRAVRRPARDRHRHRDVCRQRVPAPVVATRGDPRPGR